MIQRVHAIGTRRLAGERVRAVIESMTGARFVQVSTDEVYGDLAGGGSSTETDPIAPSSPYSVAKAAGFNLSPEKRTTLDFALDHLARHESKTIALPAGAPFGALAVDKQTCTLCKACIGACPESALIDSTETPSLRFIERNCVQCGLCVSTCPENAITLVPRLLIGNQA